MNRLPFMNYPIQDLLTEIRALHRSAHAPFMQIFGALWIHEGRLPNDEFKLASIAGVSLRQWRTLIGPEIMSRLSVAGAWVYHERLKHHWDLALQSLHTKSANAKSGWAKRKLLKNKETGHAGAYADHMQSKAKAFKESSSNGRKEGFAPIARSLPSIDAIAPGLQEIRRLRELGIEQ